MINKQEANTIAKQADLNNVFKFIEDNAKSGNYSCNLITNRYIIGKLHELGFFCRLVNEVKSRWNIDWSD